MLFALYGKGGSGKTTVAIEAVETTPAKFVVSYATRPSRKDDFGVIIVDDSQFDAMAPGFDSVEYFGDYRYGTKKSDLKEAVESSNPYLTILIPSKALELVKRYPRRVYGIYLEAPSDKELYVRQARRGNRPLKIKDRLVADNRINWEGYYQQMLPYAHKIPPLSPKETLERVLAIING